MQLNKVTLKNKFVQIFSQEDTESNVEQIAQQLADAIDDYVKEAQIVYTAGLIAPSGGGAVTGIFTGNLQ